jgi:hypothetical protein
MIAIREADIFNLGSDFDGLRCAPDLDILDHSSRVAVPKHVSDRVFDDLFLRGLFCLLAAGHPFVTAVEADQQCSVFIGISRFTFRAADA